MLSTDENGKPVVPVDSEGKPVIPVDSEGKPVVVKDSNGKPVEIVTTDGAKVDVVGPNGNPVLDDKDRDEFGGIKVPVNPETNRPDLGKDSSGKEV